ncbi:hypothetical protein AUV07_00890 [Microbacterium sp. CH1]|nr:hypothetical protein AUV07_00890 [Microbacterium sp. CH1]
MTSRRVDSSFSSSTISWVLRFPRAMTDDLKFRSLINRMRAASGMLRFSRTASCTSRDRSSDKLSSIEVVTVGASFLASAARTESDG